MITLHTSNNQGSLLLCPRTYGSTSYATGEFTPRYYHPSGTTEASSGCRNYKSTFDKMKTGAAFGPERFHDCTHRKVNLELYPLVTSVSGDAVHANEKYWVQWANVHSGWHYDYDGYKEFPKYKAMSNAKVSTELLFLDDLYASGDTGNRFFCENLGPVLVSTNMPTTGSRIANLICWDDHPVKVRYCWRVPKKKASIICDQYSFWELVELEGVSVVHQYSFTLQYSWSNRALLTTKVSCTYAENSYVQTRTDGTSYEYHLKGVSFDGQGSLSWYKHSSTSSRNYFSGTFTASTDGLEDHQDFRVLMDAIMSDHPDPFRTMEKLPDLGQCPDAKDYFDTRASKIRYVDLHGSAPSHLAKDLVNLINKTYPKAIERVRLRPPSYDELADLDAYAVDRCRNTDINSIAYLRDIKEVGSTVRAFIDAFRGRKFDAKTLSSLWLSGRYADRLTIKDTKELYGAIRRASSALKSNNWAQTVHARHRDPASDLGGGITGSRYYTSIVQYMPKDCSKLEKALRKLQDWDLWPTLNNIWDLIPYSFVVDWFVDVGGLLERVDRYAYEQYLTVLYVINGCKETYSLQTDWSSHGWQPATITYTYYGRTHTSHLHQPGLRVQTGSFHTINIIDGASLLWQRS